MAIFTSNNILGIWCTSQYGCFYRSLLEPYGKYVKVNITGFGFYLYTYRFTAELNLIVEPKLNANHILENVTVRLLREGDVPVDFLPPSSFKLYINNTLYSIDVEPLGGGVYVLKVKDLTVVGGDILVKVVDSRQIMVHALSSI